MKGLSLFAFLAISFSVFAQDSRPNDWANHNRYADANAALQANPKVVFMGNSITDFWPSRSPEFWQAHPDFCGRGISGQTSTEMLCRFRADVLELNPEIIVILSGTNDVAQNQGYIANEYVLDNIQSMIDLARFHKKKVAVCSVLPSSFLPWRSNLKPAGTIIELNDMIRKHVAERKDKNVIYVDYHSAMADETGGLPAELSPDNCHPNAAGYKIMEETLMKSIAKWLK